MNGFTKILQFTVLTASLAGCSLPITIQAPPADTKISQLCIINNPKVLMHGFLPELKSQIKSHGISTQLWTAYNPKGCRYWLVYTANWRWDFAMVLVYADLKLYDHQLLIGRTVFDNIHPGINPFYYGPADEKLKALTEPLFTPTQELK